MTKLDILRNYKPNRIRDSWVALGKNTIKQSTRIYNEGMIYQLYKQESEGYPNSELREALIYCAQEYIGYLNWNKAEIIDSEYGEISFGNDIISSHFYIILDRDGFRGITQPIDNSFIPFEELYQKTDIVKISDSDYNIIMSCLGSPFIREEELEYTREQISEIAIKPALEIMFKWCPKTRPEIVNVTTNIQNVPMPDDAYAVIGLSLQQYGLGSNNITNPLLWSLMAAPYLGLGSNFGTMYGTINRGADKGNTLLLSNAAQQGYINYQRRVHYEGPYEDNGKLWPDEPNRKYITVYSNTQGELNIWWGIRTYNFNDIEFAQRDNAFKLCQAKVKQFFGSLREQTKSDIPGQVNYKYLKEEGIKEEQEVVEVLKKLVKSSGILRGSL